MLETSSPPQLSSIIERGETPLRKDIDVLLVAFCSTAFACSLSQAGCNAWARAQPHLLCISRTTLIMAASFAASIRRAKSNQHSLIVISFRYLPVEETVKGGGIIFTWSVIHTDSHSFPGLAPS
jgi:hypothetical protein